jgi:hypothetical protein
MRTEMMLSRDTHTLTQIRTEMMLSRYTQLKTLVEKAEVCVCVCVCVCRVGEVGGV